MSFKRNSNLHIKITSTTDFHRFTDFFLNWLLMHHYHGKLSINNPSALA